MENKEKSFNITVLLLWDVLKRCFVYVLLAALIMGVAAMLYSAFTYTPRYTTEMDVYVSNEELQNSSATASSNIQNVNLTLSVLNDCAKVMQAKSVKAKVQELLAIDDSTMSDITFHITINLKDNSRILNIKVTAPQPELSYDAANALFLFGKDKVKEVIEQDMRLIDTGAVPQSPSNSRFTVWIPALAAVAGIGVYLVFLLIYLLDDRIKRADDVEEQVGLSLLGVIPNSEKSVSHGRRRGYYSGRYSEYGYYAAPWSSEDEKQD